MAHMRETSPYVNELVAETSELTGFLRSVVRHIKNAGLRVNFNIVRYNPPSPKHGEESKEEVIERNARIMREYFPEARVQIVKRVGTDVMASCGMFVK